ncbi:MAG: adenine nucleotide alpha hydrolase [Deltaproteobacteria bacterium]|nr:adenine nucleotide alpha hydrolase [Deltaproteobacteria bacterium]
MRAKKTLVSWSSGKDSAWTLHVLQQDPEIDVVGLFCTINTKADRVAMHAVRTNLLNRQAKSLGLPIELIGLPNPCTNKDYEEIMAVFVDKSKARGIEQFAFGDLFLEDVRTYREKHLLGTGIKPIFPLFGKQTPGLAREMIAGGLEAVITCVDPNQAPENLIGRQYNEELFAELPEKVDPCGENGEFHTFVSNGPMFEFPLEIKVGEIVQRDGFLFADILPALDKQSRTSPDT